MFVNVLLVNISLYCQNSNRDHKQTTNQEFTEVFPAAFSVGVSSVFQQGLFCKIIKINKIISDQTCKRTKSVFFVL